MVELLAENTVLLVLAVIGLGAGFGTLRLGTVSLGPAAALFIGLAVGAVDDDLSGAEGLSVLRELGLVLFTYTIGLSSGPNFFAAVRREGVRVVAVTLGLVVVLALGCVAVGEVLDLSGADRAGIFAGSTTNTPALQSAAEAVDDGNPVIAYSLTYPSAVVAMLVLVTLLLGRRLPLPARLEPPPPPPAPHGLVNWTVQIAKSGLPSLDALRTRFPGIAFSRVERDGVVAVAAKDQRVEAGDAVVVVGPEPQVRAFCDAVGHRSDRHLPLDRATLDFRRILVSDRRLAGCRVGELDLRHRFGATVTRVRRGDEDHVASDDFVLQLGDRVRVVAPVERLPAVARFFGDSERRLSEVDALGFAVGAALGLALGAVDVPLPGDVEVELGAGGGPLVVGLLLGMASRTGPVTWQIPHGANLVLRQIGVLMFLACAGLASGSTFADAVGTRHGLELIAAGTFVSALFAGLVPLVLQVVLRRDVIAAAGMLAGIETQPAVLTYASERTGGDERVVASYAIVFPAAMIAKIIAVQLVV